MSTTTVLITGAARGIGKGLVANFVARDNYTVIASVRDVSHANAQALSSLPTGSGSKLIVLGLDAGSQDSINSAISKLTSEHSITALDIVIANAGVATSWAKASTVTEAEILQHLQVNSLGPLFLFQATQSLLAKSTHSPHPIFFGITSGLGSITDMTDKNPMPFAAYCGSKALLNMFIRNIAATTPNLIAAPIHPGWVQTDMGNAGAAALGIEHAPQSLEESVTGITKLVDTATAETSGKFLAYDGSEISW